MLLLPSALFPNNVHLFFSMQEESGEFDWDAQTQGWVLGGFAIGYVTTMLMGGILSQKFGGKWLFGTGVAISSALGLLAPIAAKTDPYLLVALRALQGASQGPMIPSFYTIANKWFPKQEKNLLLTSTLAGKF